MLPWLVWNSLCRLGWSLTHRDPLGPLLQIVVDHSKPSDPGPGTWFKERKLGEVISLWSEVSFVSHSYYSWVKLDWPTHLSLGYLKRHSERIQRPGAVVEAVKIHKEWPEDGVTAVKATRETEGLEGKGEEAERQKWNKCSVLHGGLLSRAITELQRMLLIPGVVKISSSLLCIAAFCLMRLFAYFPVRLYRKPHYYI